MWKLVWYGVFEESASSLLNCVGVPCSHIGRKRSHLQRDHITLLMNLRHATGTWLNLLVCRKWCRVWSLWGGKVGRCPRLLLMMSQTARWRRPTDGRTDGGKKKRTGQTPSHFSSTLRLRPASQSVRSTHLLTPLSPGYTHATELRFLGGSAALRRAGNSSR